ncbi:hypothetical protein [Enterococcus sp. DIV1758]
MLLFTDKSFKEISIQLAFASQNHFIQILKKISRMTPREYSNHHYSYTVY